MKNPTKKRLWAASKAALVGGFVFGGIYLLVVFGNEVLGWHSSEGPDVSAVFASLLPELVREVFGIAGTSASFFNTFAFETLVNSFFGATSFFVCALVWQFVLKGENENET